MSETLGEKIKYYRKLKGYSQEKLAEKTNLSKMSIRRYESGERQPGLDALKKIASALECQVSDIDKSLYISRRIPYFANGLKELRTERSLTQKELAKELHVKEQNIVDWENEEREPYFHAVERIADYFGTSLLYLYQGNKKYKKGIDNNDKEAMAQEKAIKTAPRFTDYVNGKEMLDYPLPCKLPQFTDASTSFEDALAETEADELERIQNAYKQLNRKGKAKAVERIEELTEIPRYTKPATPP
jgi:Predicted transcriptional regulators